MGFANTIVAITLIVFLLCYPIAISYFESGEIALTEKGIFYSTLFILVLSIIKITNFIPEFFKISNQELDCNSNTIQEDKNTNVDYKVEKEAFEKYLVAHGISEIDILEKASFIDGDLWMQLLKTDKSEIWCNVNISVSDATNIEIRDAVCLYALHILSLFASSKIDINSIVLSFHISIANDKKSHRNIFIRSSRSEVEKIDFGSSQPVNEVSKIDNILFDELFRDI